MAQPAIIAIQASLGSRCEIHNLTSSSLLIVPDFLCTKRQVYLPWFWLTWLRDFLKKYNNDSFKATSRWLKEKHVWPSAVRFAVHKNDNLYSGHPAMLLKGKSPAIVRLTIDICRPCLQNLSPARFLEKSAEAHRFVPVVHRIIMNNAPRGNRLANFLNYLDTITSPPSPHNLIANWFFSFKHIFTKF